MATEGTIHVAHTDKTLNVGALVDSEAWLDLGEAGSLSLKHTLTGREWSVRGPAWLRACVDGQEALWLSRGELRIGTGAGVRPGAQVVLSTPHGIIRWGDASLSVKVDAKQTTVAVSAGRAWLTPAQETKLAGAEELGAKASAKLIAKGGGEQRAQLLVAACERAASLAEQLAKALLGGATPGAPEPTAHSGGTSAGAASPPSSASAPANPKKLGLGERARDQAAARGEARGSCAAAWASVGALDSLAAGKPGSSPASSAQPYADRLRKADAAWRRVPFGGAPQRADKGE